MRHKFCSGPNYHGKNRAYILQSHDIIVLPCLDKLNFLEYEPSLSTQNSRQIMLVIRTFGQTIYYLF